MTKILTAAAVISNYADMDALIGKDGQVYLGKRENYHSCIGEDFPVYYDNSDGSLELISSNEKKFSFLYGDGWTLSQRQMRRKHCFTKVAYAKTTKQQRPPVGLADHSRPLAGGGPGLWL